MGLAAAFTVNALSYSTTLESGTQGSVTITNAGYKYRIENRDAINPLWFTALSGYTGSTPAAAGRDNYFVKAASSIEINFRDLGYDAGVFTFNLAGTTNPVTITKLA